MDGPCWTTTGAWDATFRLALSARRWGAPLSSRLPVPVADRNGLDAVTVAPFGKLWTSPPPPAQTARVIRWGRPDGRTTERRAHGDGRCGGRPRLSRAQRRRAATAEGPHPACPTWTIVRYSHRSVG